MDQVFVLYFGKWCGLPAEFYSLNAFSIIESVVLRSGALLHYYITHCPGIHCIDQAALPLPPEG